MKIFDHAIRPASPFIHGDGNCHAFFQIAFVNPNAFRDRGEIQKRANLIFQKLIPHLTGYGAAVGDVAT